MQKKKKKNGRFGKRRTKNVEQSTPSRFFAMQLIPGGRYLVTGGVLDDIPSNLLSVWDLGYVSNTEASSTTQLTMWSAKVEFDGCLVHPTPDGLGLRILTYSYVNGLVYHIILLSDDHLV
jgi:hypothetical protein